MARYVVTFVSSGTVTLREQNGFGQIALPLDPAEYLVGATVDVSHRIVRAAA